MSSENSAKTVIIGGGVIGLGIAYHLAKLDAEDVLLIERNELTSGTSWHAAGIVGPLRASLNLTRMASYATELFPRLEVETGQCTGYCRTGGLWLATAPPRLNELRRIAAIGDMSGLTAQMIAPDTVAERAPFLRCDDLVGALWVDEDGQANPVDLCMAYAKGARAGGVRIREHVSCKAISVINGAVHSVSLSTGEVIRCERLVNCAGAWARGIGDKAGVPVPLQAVEHMYIVTEPMPALGESLPVVRDMDHRIYVKGDAGRLVLGGFEPHAKVWNPVGDDGDRAFIELPEDWEQFEPFMHAGLHRVPAMADTGIQHFMNGPESFTPDSKPLLGESPFVDNFYVAAGFNSIGMMSSAGVGKVMAEWIVAGEPPMDLWEVDIARFDRASASRLYLAQRMQESVSDVFDMHWPYKQPSAGRNWRRSPLHQAFARAGAVFGAPAGWERPLWFADNEREGIPIYSFDDQCWWRAAERECRAIQHGAALLELTPFTKIDVTGTDALALMQQLCTNDIDTADGQTTYTLMLNPHGGVEADLTVTRIGKSRFRLVSGAATRQRDLAWIRRQSLRLHYDVETIDATSREAVIGIVGPCARDVLQTLTDSDLSNDGLPFSTSRNLEIDNGTARITRVSYCGELGYELYLPVEFAPAGYEAIAAAGRRFSLAHAGYFALDACRLEKGYRHWGHELGPDVTPLEAGLSFAVAWKKPSGFIGYDALQRQRRAGIGKRLLLFAVQHAHPLLLHDEPIYRNGRYVGHTTSGGRGFRCGLSLCFGYIDSAPHDPREALLTGRYELDVAGTRYPLNPLVKPPYDPSGEKMRG